MTLVLRTEHVTISATAQHVVHALVRQQAVVRNGGDAEIHAIVGDVGGIARDQSGNHVHHLCDVLGGVWNIGGTQHTQLAHGLKPDVLAFSGDVAPRATFFIGAINDFVVDVGDIRDQPYLKASISQVPTQDVVHQGGSAVAKVWRAIDGRAAEVNADLAWLAKSEGFHALRGGVIEVQHSDKPTI